MDKSEAITILNLGQQIADRDEIITELKDKLRKAQEQNHRRNMQIDNFKRGIDRYELQIKDLKDKLKERKYKYFTFKSDLDIPQDSGQYTILNCGHYRQPIDKDATFLSKTKCHLCNKMTMHQGIRETKKLI